MKSWPIKKSAEINIAWLVRWRCHGQDENRCLKQAGINEKIIDVISVRKDFSKHIEEIAKDIYKREMLSFSEKVYLSNYLKGEKRRKEFFGRTVPVFTHYQSDLYRELIKAKQENNTCDREIEELSDEERKYPQYVMVGHNPYLEICKVFNLSVFENESGKEAIEWDRPAENGSLKREKYDCKK